MVTEFNAGEFGFTFQEALGIGLYFTIIGYFFLIFGYFLLFRFRRTKRMYWLYFALFFIFLAGSRVAYMFIDYFIGPGFEYLIPGFWKIANVTAWIAVSALSGILAILLFTGESKLHVNLKRIFPIIPLGIGIHIIFLPDDFIATAKLYLNFVLLPIFIILLPFMFFYLAWRSIGTLQRSFLLNGLGLLIYYIARALQPILGTATYTAALLPPLLILLGILLISFANQYEHLK